MDFAGALFAVGHKRVEFRALGLRKVYFPATRWHTPSWWSESTKILQLSKDLLEKPLRATGEISHAAHADQTPSEKIPLLFHIWPAARNSHWAMRQSL